MFQKLSIFGLWNAKFYHFSLYYFVKLRYFVKYEFYMLNWSYHFLWSDSSILYFKYRSILLQFFLSTRNYPYLLAYIDLVYMWIVSKATHFIFPTENLCFKYCNKVGAGVQSLIFLPTLGEKKFVQIYPKITEYSV